MSGVSGRVALSALDLLGLAELRKVARLDLASVGYSGVVYACDLTAAQQQKIMSGPRKGKTRIHRDGAMDVDWADLPQDAAAKFLEACLVTDNAEGETLERAFAALDTSEAEEDKTVYITLPASELVLMSELMLAELKQPRLVREKLEQFPNAVTSLIVRTVREISGMVEDRVEEKKDNS